MLRLASLCERTKLLEVHAVIVSRNSLITSVVANASSKQGGRNRAEHA
jgi:hypothetical protein